MCVCVLLSSTASLACKTCRSYANFGPTSSDSECFRGHSVTSERRILTVMLWRRNKCRCCRNYPRVISLPAELVFQRIFQHQNSTSCHVAQLSHDSSTVLVSAPRANRTSYSTRCSSHEVSDPHQQPLIHQFASLAALTSWSGIIAKTDSPNMLKGETYAAPN